MQVVRRIAVTRRPLALIVLFACTYMYSTLQTVVDVHSQAAPPSNFLFLPFDTDDGDWLSQMTSAFDHHYPDYTCSLGLTPRCKDLQMEIALWEGEIARPLTKTVGSTVITYYCYAPGSTIVISDTYCGGVAGYVGVTGDSIIYYDGHDGYDWDIPGDYQEDAPIEQAPKVLAASPGIVTDVWKDGAYGWTVKIDHENGYETLYSHMIVNLLNPSRNQRVQAGEIIGVEGCTSTYRCTGNHLHFRVLHEGKVTDPFGWCYHCKNPPPDPLISYNGEASRNLWYGNNPRTVGKPPTRDNIGLIWHAFSTSYRGGPGIWLSDNPVLPISSLFGAKFTGTEYPSDTYTANPGTSFLKMWQMKNTGNTTWGPGYKLVFLDGNPMGAPTEVDVLNTASGQTTDISVNMIVPSASAIGYWRLRNPQGTFFGDKVWVKVTVQGSNNAPPPESGPAIELKCLDCPTTVAPGQKIRPTIQAIVKTGNLQGDALRGDMLRHKSGELFGAWPQVTVPGSTVISTGGRHDFVFYENDPITAPNAPGIYESVWQIWRNGGWDGDEFVLRFEVKEGGGSNRAPSRPTLTGPGDWAVFRGTEGITLHAQPNSDPDGDAITHYYFDIFESAHIPNSGWITSSSWSPPGLGYYGYQWRVKVRDSRGAESDWSEVHHFNIENPDPEIQSFSWQWCHEPWGPSDKICFCAKTTGGGLELKLNMANDGSENGEWKTIGHADTNFNCESDNDNPPNLGQRELESGTHRVRLFARPKGPGGWPAAATADITIPVPADQRPGPPFGTLPKNGEYVGTKTIRFDWADTYRTTGYRLQAATDSGYANILLDVNLPVNQSEYTYTFAGEHETVYWRVIATGPYGSDESSQRFHIDMTPPNSAANGLPTTTIDNKFTVQWSGSDAQSGLNWYHIQVRDGNRADSEWQDWLVNTTKVSEIFNGLAGHTYYFRLRAMDAIGNWEAWPGENGDTFTQVDPAAAPISPWWNDSYAQKSSLLILNNDEDAIQSGYPVRIHLDTTTIPSAETVFNASRAATKGDDVRVVYNNQTELHRVVSVFTPDSIDIWFPVQVAINGHESDSVNYQLYVGNNAPNVPLSDVSQVFIPTADANTIGLWHFSEGAGTSVLDTSGLGHTGSFDNGGWDEGLLGTAGIFNGSNSTLNLGNYSEVNNLGAFTLEAWIRPDHEDFDMIFMKGVDGYGQIQLNLNGGNNVEFTVGTAEGGQSVSTGTRLEVGRWYHIAAVHDGASNQWIYINGVESAHKSNSRAPVARDYPLYLGNAPWWNGTGFQGAIQHVRISNIARHDFAYGKVDQVPTVALGTFTEPPIPGTVDLAIMSLQAYPDPQGGLIVAAIVQNQGDANTRNGFYTDLYVDHLPTGSGDYTGSLQFWVNSPIESGAIVTLTTQLTGLSATEVGNAEMSGGDISDEVSVAAATAAVVEEQATLYAQVDTSGLVREQDKANNISAGVIVCTAAQDALEPDNAVAQAKQLTIHQGYNHNLHIAGDMDWGKFTATGGVTYAIRTDTLGATADTYLYLYDTNGTTLLASNDDTAVSLSSEIVWKAPTDGVYYAVVKHWNTQSGGCGTTYRLLLSTVEVVTPDAPQLDGPDNAQTVTSNTPTLTWLAVASASGYQLQLASDAAFTTRIVDAEMNTTSYTTQVLAAGVYYWRVRGHDGDGNWSDWSGVRSFSVPGSGQTEPLDLYMPSVNR